MATWFHVPHLLNITFTCRRGHCIVTSTFEQNKAIPFPTALLEWESPYDLLCLTDADNFLPPWVYWSSTMGLSQAYWHNCSNISIQSMSNFKTWCWAYADWVKCTSGWCVWDSFQCGVWPTPDCEHLRYFIYFSHLVKPQVSFFPSTLWFWSIRLEQMYDVID